LGYLRKPEKDEATKHCEEKALEESSGLMCSHRVYGATNAPDQADDGVEYCPVEEQLFRRERQV